MKDNVGDFKHEFNEPTKEHLNKEKIQEKHLEFFGKSQNCCVCLVDIIESTELAAQIPDSKTGIFYSIFLNNMANIIDDYDGVIVKSIGDAMLFYFEDSLVNFHETALRCGLEMIEKRDKINRMLNDEGLPSIQYRVSSDFGKVMLGYSSISVADDIFGPVVNMCSKINPLGHPNGMVIGNDFHLMAKSLNGFDFNEIKKNPAIGLKNKYSVYDVKKK